MNFNAPYFDLVATISSYNQAVPDAELTLEGKVLYSCGAKLECGDYETLLKTVQELKNK